MPHKCKVSVITESYNLTEGASLASLGRALDCAGHAVQGVGEVLLADVDGRSAIARLLADFPDVRRIDCTGLGYDAAKNRAVQAAHGEFVAFLDGDCVAHEHWLAALIEPLRSGVAPMSCGFTRYAGGFWAAVQSVMDFGFLLPRESRAVGCYACNNWAATRSELLARPIPEQDLRCSCYPHAQAMHRRGAAVVLVPDALVEHDLPPFWSERLRRGWDLVAVCWADGELAESRLLRRGLKALPAFYCENVALDWRRLRSAREQFALTGLQTLAARVLMPLLRIIDVIGIARALRRAPLGP